MCNLITTNTIIVPKAAQNEIKVFCTKANIEEFITAKIKAEGGADSIRKLMSGNRRHLEQEAKHSSNRDEQVATEFVKNGQKPIVTMLSCADSRVKTSRIFDKADGRIFAIKNAGNIAYNPFTLGDLEYGVKHLKTPILMVMGHEFCGAVSAACTHKGHLDEGNITYIVERIGITAKKVDFDAESTILLNVFDTIEQIRLHSNIIANHEKEGKVDIVAAYYSISTGQVALLDWN